MKPALTGLKPAGHVPPSPLTRSCARPRPTRPLLTQPMVGLVTSATGVGVVAGAWLVSGSAISRNSIILAAALLVAFYLSYQFPVHIRYVTKIYMGSVPLYLMAVLLPPPLAALVACVGAVAGELSVQRMYLSDIGSQAGRWMIVELLGSFVAHAALPGLGFHIGELIATAVVLQVGDIITAPLSIIPLTNERLWPVVAECARGVGLPETGQYFMGFMGALLALYDIWAVLLLVVPLALVYRVSKSSKELHDSTRRLLEHMADSVDGRDPYTHQHSVRVTEWTRQLLGALDISGPEAQLIITAARVHDIGKLAIPDEILQKHEQLTPEEWKLMERHPVIGADMLVRYPAFTRGAEIVRGHHERVDGAGYPQQLRETDIPFGARVIAVADSFDAMTSDRPYRAGMRIDEAAAVLRGGRGTQWDAEIVDAFLAVIADQIEEATAGMHVTSGHTGSRSQAAVHAGAV